MGNALLAEPSPGPPDAAGAGCLPCPFCGSLDLVIDALGVTCGGCNTMGPSVHAPGGKADVAAIRAAWNRRALLDTPAPAG